MDLTLRDRFLERWRRYFGGEELPLAFWYTDEETAVPLVSAHKDRHCLLAELARVRAGEPLRFGATSFACLGGRRYAGYGEKLRPNFEYFLSTGIPGQLEGERYKKSPEIVREWLAHAPAFRAPGRFLVFKRWDQLAAADAPAVAVFFARPDALAGLFTLAGYPTADEAAVVAPFGAGCSTLVQRPYLEQVRTEPRAVLGTFDVSARPFVPADVLSFAVPVAKLAAMVDDMDESFLTTHSWELVRERLHPATPTS